MRSNKRLDLKNNKYSMDVLRENIYATGLLEILQTQTINEEFAVNYILNKRFQLSDDEEKITFEFVLKMQPHFSKEKLLRLYLVGPLDNDFPNFEKYAEAQ